MGVYITMGYPLYMLFQYWSGDERGVKCPNGLNIFPVCVPVGTQVPHAVGAAMGVKYRGDKKAVAAYFGDGGTSEGDFHEGMNFAGVFKLLLFLSARITIGQYQFREKTDGIQDACTKGLCLWL